MVDDVPMSPVDARLPPTLASTATAATSDKPEEVPVICDALACGQVEDVPMPPVDTRVPPTSASSATTTAADEHRERSQGEDVPITLVRATFASSAATAIAAYEAPLATIVVGGESVCVPIGDALMPPVQVRFSSTSASIGTTNNAVVDIPLSPVDDRLPPALASAATTATSTTAIDDEPSEVPVTCGEFARTQVESVPMPLAASADIDVDQPGEATPATMVEDESVRSLIEDVDLFRSGFHPIQPQLQPPVLLVKRIWL